jgi:hypothetical protein
MGLERGAHLTFFVIPAKAGIHYRYLAPDVQRCASGFRLSPE